MTDTKVEPPPKVDLDYVLVNELGQFGKYQILTIFLAAFPVVFSAFAAGEYIFSVSRIQHRWVIFVDDSNQYFSKLYKRILLIFYSGGLIFWTIVLSLVPKIFQWYIRGKTICLIPECDDVDPELAPSWLLNAIPGNTLTDFDNCARYNLTSNTVPVPGTCPATLFNQEQTLSCEEYVYERTNSVVYDFGLECQEWRRTLAGTLNSVGTLLVLPITGYISDRFGRRWALIINAINTGVIGFIRAFSVNYEMYVALQLLQMTLGAGAYSSCFLLATELVGPKFRIIAGGSISTLFALGQVTLGFIAWGIPEWRTLNMVLFGPQILVAVYFWILLESVRWLLSKNKYNEAKKVLLRAAKINGKTIKDKTMEALIHSSDQDALPEKDANEPSLVMRILRSRIMLRRCCTTPVWWLTTTFVYYGLSINSVGLAGNMYLNYIAVAAIDIPGYWLAIFLLGKIGRKITLCIGFWTASACCIAFAFTPDSLPTLSLCLYLLGKLAISLVFTSIYIYTAELYPTRHRHSLLAFSSMIGRIGSITAPLTPALMMYWEGIPSVMFGALALLSGGLVLTTPETLGTKLPDTIEEAEMIGRGGGGV